jgi:membrane-bound inhibitor of C-type lysozyme
MVLTVCVVAFYLAGTGFREQVYSYLFPPAPKTITYFCREGIVKAIYMDQKVRLVLPDGRKFELPQVVAASGIRFSDGKREFWSKVANAFVTENNKVIFSDGVAGTVDHPNPTTATFIDSSRTFSFSYPRQFILSGKGIGLTPSWRAGTTDSGMVLVLVTIPKSFAPKTNLSGVEFIIGQSNDPDAVKHCFEKHQEYGASR